MIPLTKGTQRGITRMELCTTLLIKIVIPDNEVVPIECLIQTIKAQEIERKTAEAVLNTIDDIKTCELCGEKYSRTCDNRLYCRAGTSTRTISTTIGEISFQQHKIKNMETNNIFKPIQSLISFSGKQKYQRDIIMVSVDFAEKMSYRDTVTELSLIASSVPSRTTINNYAKIVGEQIPIQHEDANLEVAIGDGTKTHSQEPNVSQNDVKVLIGLEDKKKVLLGITVNQSWAQMAKTLEDEHVLNEYATIVSDGEVELKNAFSNGNKQFQMDIIHGFRMLGFKLWEDKELNLDERKQIINELKSILLSLKNTVLYHKDDKNKIKVKMNETVNKMKVLSDHLKEIGCKKAANFIRDYSNTLVTFARLSLEGIEVPWNSNIIERLMGEIAKRVKHKWMRWTTHGLESLLRLILVRYTDNGKYSAFRDWYSGKSICANINITVIINPK